MDTFDYGKTRVLMLRNGNLYGKRYAAMMLISFAGVFKPEAGVGTVT
jgi:hypothetical protein